MKKITTLLLTILTCILISGCGSNAEVKRLERQVEREIKRSDEYKAMVDELKAENAELRVENNALNIDLQDYLDEVEYLENQVSDLKGQVTNSSNSDLVATLNSQIASKDKEISNLKAQLSAMKNSSSYSSYLAIKFWSDGYNYYSKETVWYSDCNCSNKLSNQDIVITSPIISKDALSNGYTVYSCMSTTGLVYSSTSPSLYKIAD